MTSTTAQANAPEAGKHLATALNTASLTLLVVLGIVGHFAVPAGPARAVLVLPAILWVPGRSLVAALGVTRTAGRFTAGISVVLSLAAVIFTGLLTYLVQGHIPLAVLPLWVSGALLPLNLLERPAAPAQPRALLATARTGTLLCAGLLATGAIWWTVQSRLPTTPQQPYLSFSLGAPYTAVRGVVPVRAGAALTVPVSVDSSRAADLSQYTVTALVDGQTPRAAKPVAVRRTGANNGAAKVTVGVPQGCAHQIRLVLSKAGEQLRSVDLYVDATAGRGRSGGCGGG